jgi:kynureninase
MIPDAVATEFRSRFPIFDRKIYLNSCSLGPLSRQSRAALEDFANDWEEFGAPAWWLKWMPKIDEVSRLFAELVRATREEVTIHHSISSALSSISNSIDYSRRRRVVVADIDFPTIAYQWLANPEVEVVFARSSDGISVPIEEYERLIDDRTALVATSHVFYATGAVQDVKTIAEIAHRHGAMMVVDGYHSFGVLPIDVSDLGVDFYLAGTLKWACGGPGLTFIYAAQDATASLTSRITGWFASADQFAFETTRYEPAASARRFQLGTPAIATVYSGIPGLEMLREATVPAIWERIRSLTSLVVDRVEAEEWDLASPSDADSRGGIVMLRLSDPDQVVESLAGEGVIIDARPGKIRISPHFYNTEADVQAALQAIASHRQQSAASAAAGG